MYKNEIKRVKINLLLLVFLTLFIVALTFTVIHILNSSQASTNNSSDYASEYKTNNKIIESNMIDTDEDSLTSYTTIPNISSESNSNTNTNINYNNHSYIFDKNDSVELLEDNLKQYIKFDYNGYIYRINTDTISFSNLKKQNDLKSFLAENYRINITSDIKSGNYNNLDLILCTISDGDAVGYFVITPLKNNEIVYFEIYNSYDTSMLISDLTDPLNYIDSKIKSSIQ